ncbi:hypothetical protein CBER1_02758 [Cercospora berteroae]|uniref:Ecp2 effector protein-like domain-containing protein n=1 Tax=Cercospora berteroae TaxID=357750 RepID=A0A2S6C6M3_9PEZI|nr:hypothetical protein CBER1_02758 [Cercospora berteroae]
MQYTTSVLVALLPALGTATRFRSSGASDNAPQAAMLGASNVQQNPNGQGQSNAGSWQNPNGQVPDSNGNWQNSYSGGNGHDQWRHGNTNAGNAPGVNDCGISSFIEITQPAGSNPLVTDCQALVASIQQDYEWTVTSQGQTLVYNGTCAFNAVTSSGQDPDLTGKVGNADIIDLVTDSIKKYAKDGTVGCRGGYSLYASSAGAMPCDSPDAPSGKQVSVDWTLTHSGQVGGQGGQGGQGGKGGQGGHGGQGGQGGYGGRPNQPGQPGQGGQWSQGGQPNQGGQWGQGSQPGQGGQWDQEQQAGQGGQWQQGGQSGQNGYN